jgi:hypothetical protein
LRIASLDTLTDDAPDERNPNHDLTPGGGETRWDCSSDLQECSQSTDVVVRPPPRLAPAV